MKTKALWHRDNKTPVGVLIVEAKEGNYRIKFLDNGTVCEEVVPKMHCILETPFVLSGFEFPRE